MKDQGSLGTCWIFSTVGNLEGQKQINGGDLVDLSVEHVLECDSEYDDEHGDCGMFGGWPFLAMQGIIKRGGIFADADMPYCAAVGYGKDGSCMPCMADDYSEQECGNHSDDDGGEGGERSERASEASAKEEGCWRVGGGGERASEASA